MVRELVRFETGSRMVREWFETGSRRVLERFDAGSRFVRDWFDISSMVGNACKNTYLPNWLDTDSRLALEWFKTGSRLVRDANGSGLVQKNGSTLVRRTEMPTKNVF